MILHDSGNRAPLSDFGIEIPITGSNEIRTLEHLLAQPDIAARREEWLVEEVVAPLAETEIRRVHEPSYVTRLMDAAGDGGHSPCEREMMNAFELVNEDGSYHRYDPSGARRSLCDLRDQGLRLAAGTRRGAELALTHPERFCFYLGGGMHHGHYDFGHGFCMVNDLVIAVRSVQAAGLAGRSWVVDVDAHKGDGTAALTVADDTIHTLSIHMAKGWPLDQPMVRADGTPNPAWTPSDIDVLVESGEEHEYLPRLEAALIQLEHRFQLPDFLLVVDGADPYERDQLPSAELLKMSREQLLERDTRLYRWARERAIPTLFVMAGNYGYHSWEIYSQFLERQVRGELD